MRDCLQDVSDRDEDARAQAEWVNSQPDISDGLLREQLEQHDRDWIEMGGY